ncbi:glycerophosphodiester phosphodiesterase family protein [Novosphingobium pokkalii]|uniref:glycerophosphodiester phosphodiesterase n=1 Tax=Novosphingobium pokkalii TaxID=1770194 RepID=A0ABV7V4K9_9SPHN|nr:glycerophosphodiester phosphodiesterase family protein [Novosphingobium pokkalii]GHC92512.1 glycerophosphoryl diester phosphodiesterase [Novosphingobium pokkalii]
MTVSRRSILAMGASAAMLPGARALAGTLAKGHGRHPRPAHPLVLGHRGACAHRPEHTLASYQRAVADGADFIEPDLVPTRDGVLVSRHEPNIAETTDVAAHPEFAARKTTKVIDGERQEGWFVEDFTLAELKTLRAKERLGALRPESMAFDGQFPVLTFDEIVAFAAKAAQGRRRPLGIIPEIKHSTYFHSLGHDMEAKLIAAIRAHPWLQQAPVIVQSFEVENLKRLRPALARWRNIALMQLADEPDKRPGDVLAAGGALTYAQMLSAPGLAEVALYADWIAPWSRTLMAVAPDGRLAPPQPIIADAHRVGLLVGAYTFRPEPQFLPPALRQCGAALRCESGSMAEIRAYLAAGLDGFFTDDPGLGRRAVDGA